MKNYNLLPEFVLNEPFGMNLINRGCFSALLMRYEAPESSTSIASLSSEF
jgi:hypothetical protein